jgi:hypothetical protein
MDIKRQETQERLLFKNTPWEKIREVIRQKKEVGFSIQDVEEILGQIIFWVNKVL